MKKIIGIAMVLLLLSVVMVGTVSASIEPLADDYKIKVYEQDGTIVEKTAAELGSFGTVYGIADANDLYELATNQDWVKSGNNTFVFTNDIDCSGVSVEGSDPDNFPSIGKYTSQGTSYNYVCNANFYGNGKIIREFKQHGADAAGLIYVLGCNNQRESYVLNYIQMENCCINSSITPVGMENYDVGCIAGKINADHIRVTGCSVKNSTVVSMAGYKLGGIIGNCGTGDSIVEISYCTVDRCLISDLHELEGFRTGSIGGITGYASSKENGDYHGINHCSVTNSVLIGKSAGGIVNGINSSSLVTDCTVDNCLIIGISHANGVIDSAGSMPVIRNVTVSNTTVGTGHGDTYPSASGVTGSFDIPPEFNTIKMSRVAVTSDISGVYMDDRERFAGDEEVIQCKDTYLYGELRYHQGDFPGVTTGKKIVFYDADNNMLGDYTITSEKTPAFKISKSVVDGKIITDVGKQGIDYGYIIASEDKHKIKVNGSHVTVTLSASSAISGTVVVFNVIPDEGYMSPSIETNPEVSIEGNESEIHSFIMPDSDITITVTCQPWTETEAVDDENVVDFSSKSQVSKIKFEGKDMMGVKVTYTNGLSSSSPLPSKFIVQSGFDLKLEDSSLPEGVTASIYFNADTTSPSRIKLLHEISSGEWETLQTSYDDESESYIAVTDSFSPFAIVLVDESGPETKLKSSSVTSFRGIKDGSDFTFDRAVVITKATLPGASSATIVNGGSGNGWYNCTLSTVGFSGEGILYFQVPLDVIEIKGWTVNDVSLLGCKTTYLKTDGQYAKYSAVINKDGTYSIDFEKDAAAEVVVQNPVTNSVTETKKEDTTPVNMTKVDSSTTKQKTTETAKITTEQKQTANSPFPVLGILAGIGAAGVIVMRRK